MIDEPRILESEEQHYAFIHLMVPRPQMPILLPSTLGELCTALSAQGVASTGPWFAHHLTLDDNDFDFEVCLPVAKPFNPVGTVQAGKWPAGRLARTIYHGDYPGLPAAWGEFSTWIKASGHVAASHIYERYTRGPVATPNIAEWTTELSWPLVS